MALTLYNTLSREKAPFAPIDPGHVRIYVCGPTVYDLAHIGNARPVVVFDVLYRLMRRLYPKVTYVRNITDVDDKIIDAAKAENIPIDTLTARTADAFHEDMAQLSALEPDFEPRATEHIPQMIAMIEKLIITENAYEAEGHVLFHVPSMADYGRLSRRDRREMLAGARVEVAAYKKDPADFVLWKPSAGDQPGWDSPWGRGRPGWHIECSAMSEELLGECFDIHGGGLDLVFPHHENEIAQSRCAHKGGNFVNVWMHNGYLTVDGEKMSKSLGNFLTVRELLEMGLEGESLRLALLKAHYRQPLDFTVAGVKECKGELDYFYTALFKLKHLGVEKATAPHDDVLAALEDDLNTPLALSLLHDHTKSLNQMIEAGAADQDMAAEAGKLMAGGDVLGLLQQDPEARRKGVSVGLDAVLVCDDDQIDEQIAKRVQARKSKDYAEADRIRAELESGGVVLEDKPDGATEWRRAE